MSNSIQAVTRNTPQATAVAESKTPARSSSTTASSTTPKAEATKVSLSKEALLAAAKEVAETPAQTAAEARGNDRQAQRLLAKEAAKHG